MSTGLSAIWKQLESMVRGFWVLLPNLIAAVSVFYFTIELKKQMAVAPLHEVFIPANAMVCGKSKVHHSQNYEP